MIETSIGLYVIGDEILSGKRQDKHLTNLSKLLEDKGLLLNWVKFLGDDFDLLVSEFKQSFSNNELVFSCGGIGATPDDLTRQAVATALNSHLEPHQKGLNILKSIEHCSGQVILATVLYSIQYFSSATFGAKPSLCR